MMSESETLLVELFGDYYYAHLSPCFQPWRFLEDLLLKCSDPLDCQSSMLNFCLREHPSAKYPVSEAFQGAVGHWMLALCAANELPIHPGFEKWSQQVEADEPEYIFKTYKLQDSHLVLLEENRDPIGHGTTGLISWQGAALLSSWAETFGKSLLGGKRVLELGSGLGLFGISLAKSEVAAKVTLTDGHEKVLNFLRINVALNSGQNEAINYSDWTRNPPEIPNTSDSPSIQRLDWTDFEPTDLPKDVDVVVGSDLVYSPDLIVPLVRILKCLLQQQPGDSVAYIACTHRNGTAVEDFLKTLTREGLRWELFLKRAFGPQDGITVNHEPLRPVSLFKITS